MKEKLKELEQVNRDILAMLLSDQTEKTKKRLADAIEYRSMLENEVADLYKKLAENGAVIIGFVISLN